MDNSKSTADQFTANIVQGQHAKAASSKGGLNMQLPDAHLADHNSWNKLSFYEQAEKDSAKYQEAILTNQTLI